VNGYSTCKVLRKVTSSVLPGPRLLHLMAQAGAAASPALFSAVQALGGTAVDDISIQLIMNGDSPQGVRVLGILPVHLQRTKPLGGTLFYIPSQGASASLSMMFDLDEAVPVARTIVHPPCHDITQSFATFDLEIEYVLGTASDNDVLSLIVSDHGQPFRVTGMSAGAKPGSVSYQAAYTVNEST
jgi:hypothetical protein